MPYVIFLFAGRVIVFDHIKQKLFLVSSSLTVEPSQEWFVAAEDRLGKMAQPQRAPIMSSISGPLDSFTQKKITSKILKNVFPISRMGDFTNSV